MGPGFCLSMKSSSERLLWWPEVQQRQIPMIDVFSGSRHLPRTRNVTTLNVLRSTDKVARSLDPELLSFAVWQTAPNALGSNRCEEQRASRATIANTRFGFRNA
jgi:hypothetical protein